MTKWKGVAASYAPHAAELFSCAPRASAAAVLAAALLGGLAIGPASAADRYWDANQDGAGSGGAGAWDVSNFNWSPNSDGTSGPYNTAWSNTGVVPGTLDNAIFGGTAGTVTLGAPITVHDITFDTGGYTLTGNTLTLDGTSPTITVNSGTSTINSVIAGSAGLMKAGGGMLLLNGVNTFSGDITLDGGQLRVSNDAAFGDTDNEITTTANATLTVLSGTTNRTVSIASGTTLTVSGLGVGSALFTGSGNLNVVNGVTLNDDNNDFTGTVQLNGANQAVGNINFTSVRNEGQESSLGAGGTITFTGGSQFSDRITYTGTGDTSDRDWVMAGGTLRRFDNAGSGTLTLTGNFNLAQSTQFNAASADFDLQGVLSGVGPAVTFTAALGRSVTLGGANTFTGAAGLSGAGVVNASVLADAGVASSFGQGSAISISGTTLRFTGTGASTDRQLTSSGNASIHNDGSGALSLTGDVSLTDGTLNLGGVYGGTNTVSGVISGAGGVASAGSGTWELTGANTYTGATTVNGGTLRAGGADAFGASTSFVVDAGTLDLNGFDRTVSSLSGTGGQLALNGGANLTVQGSGATNTTFAGSITGDGGLTKTGTSTSTLTLTGQSTYTGDTTVNGGTLALNFAGAGAPTSNIISSDSTLNMTGGAVAVTGVSGQGNTQTFDGLNVTAGSNRITATDATVDFGAISRTGGLIDFGVGTGATFTTTNADGNLGGWATVTTGTSSDYAKVEGGTIVAFTDADYVNKDDASTWTVDGEFISDAGGLPNTAYFGTVGSSVQLGGLRYAAAQNSTVDIAAGQTLGIDGTIVVASSVGNTSKTIQGGQLTGTAGGGTLGVLHNGTGTFAIASTIVDNGGAIGFTKAGTGTVNLTGTNSYTGATTLSGGTLGIATVANGGADSSIGASSSDSSNLVIENGRLLYSGVTATTDRGFTLIDAGPERVIEVQDAGANLAFTGLVTSPDGAGFTKRGAGTLTLANAANDYAGVTRIEGGMLSVNTLADGGAASGIGISDSSSSNLVLTTGGTLQYTGATTSSDRGFTLASGNGGINVSQAGTELTLSGVAVGTGNFQKSGDGVLVLSGTNTYTGNNTVQAGTLRAGNNQAFGGAANGSGAGAMTVAAGATLDVSTYSVFVGGLNGAGGVTIASPGAIKTNANGTFSGVISGTGGVEVRSGTQTMVGCNNTYTGATTIDGGTLATDCIRDGDVASGIGASPADASNLVLANNGTLQYTGGDVTTDRGFHLAAGWGRINVAEAATTLEFTGDVTNAGGGGLQKMGPGSLMLSGTNGYNGTLVSQGTLIAGSAQALGAGALYIEAGASVDMTGFSNTVAVLSDNATAGGEIRIADKTLTLSGGSATFAGTITGTSGSFVKNGSGTQTLSGCGNDYEGSTTIGGGWLRVACLADGDVESSIGASSSDAANLVIGGPGNAGLVYVGDGDTTDRQFTLGAGTGYIYNDGTGALEFTNTAAVSFEGTGARTLRLGGANQDTNIMAASLGDNDGALGHLVKEGAGTWRVTSTTSTYTGITTIQSGVLEVVKLADGDEASSIGAATADSSNLRIGTEGHLRYIGTGDSTDRLFRLGTGATYIESSGTGAINFTGTGGGTMSFSGPGPRTLALGGTYTGDNIMGVVIQDQEATAGKTTLAKNDAGTWILTGNNTYTGNTVINDGKLIIGNGGTTGNVGTGDVILAFSTGVLGFNRNDTVNFAGKISGPGIIEQMGEGTTVLTAVNSAGTTRITEGTLQIDGDLTTDTISFDDDEATTLVVNGSVQGNGVPAAITGDGSSNIIDIGAGGILNASGDLGGGSDAVTLAGTLDTGGATLGLGVGDDTLTLNDGAAILGAGVDGGAGTDTLDVNNALALTLDGASVNSFESLLKQNTGVLTLTGNHAYATGTTIAEGTLQIGNGATAGTLATPTVVNDGTLAFNLNNAYSFAGAISGSGGVNKLGTGITTLTGTNSYAGATNVGNGTLLINGDQTGATGPTSVAGGASLGGTGIIGGDVTVANGATLSPGGAGNAPGELTVNGNLTLGGGSIVAVDFGQADVVGGPFNDLVTVGGDLVLDGTLEVTETTGGTFGPGVYRVFDYGGTLTDNGLAVSSPDYFVQTSDANQVNLINSQGLALSFWDGNVGPHSNGVVDGGDGTWRAAGDQNWTDDTGLFAAPFANASFAIFQGAAGTVEVDDANGQVQALGMQFATDGYVIQGDGIELVDDPAQPGLQSIIRVGDGTAAGAGYVATIASALSGATQLVKTDFGTLVLSGTNTYTSGTAINGGTVQISSDANLGAAGGGLGLDGGTLRNTAAVVSARTVTLGAGGGTFDTLDTLTLDGAVGGTGTLTKTSAGTLVLTGSNSYQGGTVINGGTVEVSANTNLGDAAGALTFDGGTLHTTGTFTAARDVLINAGGGTFDTDGLTTLTLTNAIGGAGALTKDGAGTLVLAGTGTYAGGTTIADGTLQLGNGGASGAITGDVLNDGILAFNRNDTYTFAGLVSGSGALEQIGSGVTVLTADNSYAGATDVREGTLIVNGDQSAATGTTTVEDGGVLGGIGTIGGDVAILDGGVLSPGNVGTTPGTLTINGSLTLAENAELTYHFGEADVVGGAYNDLTIVKGDLTLDGNLNVAETPGGNFGPGLYRIISYDGALTNLGLSESSPDHVVQTSVAGQVNLVDISSMTLNFWDGDTGPKDDNLVNGGDGVWRAAGDDNWTEETGSINAAFSNGSFAIFAGAAGTVDVDNTNGQVEVTGMQFATDGYRIQGDNIVLAGPQAILRVGDGTAPGAAYVATVASVLEGDAQLVKRDLGTLVLTADNTYTGGTLIGEGTVQISGDANLGDAAGGLTLDGGTLQNTAAITSARAVTLDDAGGTFLTDADLTLSGIVGGAGGLTKTGSAALTLTGANTYGGPTTVAAGSLFVEGDQSGATGLLSVEGGATLGGSGVIGGSVTVADGGVLTPGAADGTPGTLSVAGGLTLSGGSVLNYSFGEANVAGGALNDLITVGGDLVLDGTLNVSVSTGGTFGPGIYRVFTYDGALTDNGLTVGTIPSTDYFVQTAIANQVNLVNTAGLTLNYWDGAAGPKFDGAINGGDGVWQGSAGNDNWTDDTGGINDAYTDGAFAIFSGAAGTVTVDGSLGQVTAAGMQFTVDGYLIEGDRIDLGSPQATIRVGDGTNAGEGMTATISSELAGSTQLVKTDLGTLVLTGTNSYSGGTALNGGTLQVSDDANLGDAAGALSFADGTLHTTDSFESGRAMAFGGAGTLLVDAGTTLTSTGAFSGGGSFTKDGGGTLRLEADSSGFTGTTSVEGGTLDVGGSLCGHVNVRDGGRLEGTGTVCDTTNFAGGTIAAGNSGVPGTLTVAGDYTGSGGTLEIETVLGDDASPTDRLLVTGDTSGTTDVKVLNLAGGGAKTVEGIKIIDVGGASDGTFSLVGDYTFEGEQAVVGGAYAYRLYKGGVSTPSDGDWYLRSTLKNPPNSDPGPDPVPDPLYSPGVPLYEAYAGVLQSLNELGTLQQRVGNRSWGGGATPQGADVPGAGPVDGKAIWARIDAAHAQFEPETSTTGTDYDVTTWKLQAGIDGLLHETGAGVLVGGLAVHYGTVSSDVSSMFGEGTIDATGYGFGGTLTWYGYDGFYADAQAQATWYDSDLTSRTLGTRLADGNGGFGYALGIEAGKRIDLNDRWSLTPQAQLAYSAVDFDDFTDPYGAAVSLNDGDRLIGRLGVSLDYQNQWTDQTGQVSRAHAYAIANLYHDFLDGTEVNVSGTNFAREEQALWGGVGLGASLSWADGRYAVFGEANARGSFEDFGDSYGVGAKLGFNVKW